MNIILFEDEACRQLAPVNLCRPTYAITCATYRLYDWVCEFEGKKTGLVRDYLREIQSLDFPAMNDQPDLNSPVTILINARIVPCTGNMEKLVQLIGDPADSASAPVVAKSGDTISVARVPTETLKELPVEAWPDHVSGLSSATGDPPAMSLFGWPHDVIRENMDCFQSNLAHRIENGDYREIADNVFAKGESSPGEFAIMRTESGPVVLEENVSIGPFSYFRGPVYVGAGSKINEHASIKDYVSLGHTSRVGGEVEAVVFEPWSNKQHHGFLGHSYVGSWVNLGAGTCNSDLKNTYGNVNLQYDDPQTGATEKVASGMQFVGCVIGDYSKSAINTSIFTGKTIGVASMLYGFVTTNVPSFVNYARSLGRSTEMAADVMVTTQQRMFGRRSVPHRPADARLLEDVFRLTSNGRDGLSSGLPEFHPATK